MSDPQLNDVDLVAVTSHELRTPLAAIKGFTETLRRHRGQLSDDEFDEFLDVIAVQTDRLLRMVDDLLSISRLAHGTMTIEPETVTLVPFLESVVSTQPERERVRLRITTDLPASMHVDPLRLSQLLTNLVQNALRHGSTTEPVSLAASGERERDVVFEVIDRGPGIDPSQLERIFEPFYRAPGPSTAEGAGLGLAITRSLVTAMGGSVSVTSVVGQGSTFRVTIPAEG